MKDTSELVCFIAGRYDTAVGGGEYYLYTRVRYIRSEKEGRAYICESDYKQRMLVPPKLVLTYKPSTLLKDKFK